MASDADRLLEQAWPLIANVSGGDWSQQPDAWRFAVENWRHDYFQHREGVMNMDRRNWTEGTVLRRVAEIVKDEWGIDLIDDYDGGGVILYPKGDDKDREITLADLVDLLHKRIVRREMGLDAKQQELPLDGVPKPRARIRKSEDESAAATV